MNYFINQRVKDFIESREIKAVDFAKEIGLNSDRVSKWFRMKEKIPAEHVIIIIEKYKDIDARWLLTGEGEMNTGGLEIAAEPKPIYKNGDCCALCEGKDKLIATLEKSILDKETIIELLKPKKETGASNSAQLGQVAKG